MMRIRQRMLTAALAAARAGVEEVGPNNHGPWVKKFLAEVGLPEGYAWCDAFVSYEAHAAAGRRLPIESASVAVTYAKARELGWDVSGPARGDLVLFDFDGDGQADDHIGIVISAGGYGRAWWKLNTVEGNTSSGRAGSQADGGGVYVRTRIVRRSSVRFIRIPGIAPRQITVTITGDGKKIAKAFKNPNRPTLKKGARGPAVRRLQHLLAKHGARITVDGQFGQRTAASVKAFQKRNGLKATGVVAAKTWQKLNAPKKAKARR